jgi:hypothetical protein
MPPAAATRSGSGGAAARARSGSSGSLRPQVRRTITLSRWSTCRRVLGSAECEHIAGCMPVCLHVCAVTSQSVAVTAVRLICCKRTPAVLQHALVLVIGLCRWQGDVIM